MQSKSAVRHEESALNQWLTSKIPIPESSGNKTTKSRKPLNNEVFEICYFCLSTD